ALLRNPIPRPVRPFRTVPRLALLSLIPILLAPLSAALAAQNVRVQADGKTLTLPQTADTVRAALADARVALGPDDEVTPALDAHLEAGALIRVARVTYTEAISDVRIPYHTVVRAASRA